MTDSWLFADLDELIDYCFDDESEAEKMTDEKYKEIHVLNAMLNDAKIPHTFDRIWDGWQICYPKRKRRVCDIVEHSGTYGASEDKLEMMGLCSTAGEVDGWLTATECFERIKYHWECGGKRMKKL